MIHSADKMKADVQRAIARYSNHEYVRSQRIAAYVAVQSSSAQDICTRSNLPVNDAWRLYYCDNLSVGKIADILQTDTRSVKLLIHQSVGIIAKSFLEGESL